MSSHSEDCTKLNDHSFNEVCICEENPEANNYSSLPSDVKNWKEFEEWEIYDNSEFRAGENFKECWQDVDNLKNKFGEVYLINLNQGDAVRPEEKEKRYTFGFNYAIAKTTPEDREILRYLIKEYRHISGGWTTKKAVKKMIPAMQKIKSFPFVEDHFS